MALSTVDQGSLDLLLRDHISYETPETALLEGLLPDVTGFLDIGAGYGFYTALAAEWMRGGYRLAAEANPDVFACLTRTVDRLPSTAAVQAAVVGAAGPVNFYQSRSSQLSSAVRPVGRQITVNGRTVDDLWPSGTPLDLVKCDVEGGELEVLRGASETMGRHQPVWMLEVDPLLLREAGVSVDDLASAAGDGSILWLDGETWVLGTSLAEVAWVKRSHKSVLIVPPSRLEWVKHATEFVRC
jgi:FkbM family methyltransferase